MENYTSRFVSVLLDLSRKCNAQWLQLFIQKRVVTRALGGSTALVSPCIAKALNALPILQNIAAYVVGIGFRREHVRTPQIGVQS
jgi:hypothetical protein